MVELKIPTKMNRGCNVRTKLLHKHGRQLQEKNNLCFRYYKWVLWFSLSLYFFSSYFISYKPIPIPQSHIYSSKSAVVSRALSESTNSTFLPQHPKSDQGNIGLLKNLKIYVYELPSKYNTDWLINERCSSHLFASEVAIHRALLNSDDGVRTFDPFEADFFFVPVYVSCNFSTANGFPAIGHARSLLSSAVHLVSSTYPFWNRSLGADHVFVASHDYGACFRTMVF
uniref:Uncharacterized protein MANES_11G151600 n=1 Tax=Rhizophora mucronata TaxID=61149 RepID=A0A2P2JDP3_RHIMU